MLCIPKRCLPLLREQRTHYTGDIERAYSEELERTFEGMAPYLPESAEWILDIGCGMAGIDVFLAKRYPEATIVLLDKHGVSPVINAGFNALAEDFAHYHDFSAALELLRANGIENPVECVDIAHDPFPTCEFDVVVSLLSWGFHYPLSTYSPACRGVIVADIRKGTDTPPGKVIHEGEKFRRVAWC